MKHDIESEQDIIFLVDEFYARVLKHEGLAPFFRHLDFEKHKPKMVHFWSFVILDKPGYTTNVFDKHAGMALNQELFNEWVRLFHATVDQLFEGERAHNIKLRASVLGFTFGSKFSKPDLWNDFFF